MPEQRPTFSTLMERFTACTQDPEIMNSPLPSFFRPASTERDTTIMRPSNEDFCLQVPNSSDYLIPLPDSRAIAERLLTEATGVTIPNTLSTYTLTNSHKNMTSDTNCWETSFSKPITKPKLCSNDSMEDRLISLDTPHQTPTTIDPPQPFCNSPIQNMPTTKSHSNAITLDPAALQHVTTSYANVKMQSPANPERSESEKTKYNGNVNNNSVNNNNNSSKDKIANPPFSIQGYSENHSEISC